MYLHCRKTYFMYSVIHTFINYTFVFNGFYLKCVCSLSVVILNMTSLSHCKDEYFVVPN